MASDFCMEHYEVADPTLISFGFGLAVCGQSHDPQTRATESHCVEPGCRGRQAVQRLEEGKSSLARAAETDDQCWIEQQPQRLLTVLGLVAGTVWRTTALGN